MSDHFDHLLTHTAMRSRNLDNHCCCDVAYVPTKFDRSLNRTDSVLVYSIHIQHYAKSNNNLFSTKLIQAVVTGYMRVLSLIHI